MVEEICFLWFSVEKMADFYFYFSIYLKWNKVRNQYTEKVKIFNFGNNSYKTRVNRENRSIRLSESTGGTEFF